MHSLVAGVLRKPLLGGHLVFGQVAGARIRKLGADLGGLLGKATQQQAPAAFGDIDHFAVDPEYGCRAGLTDINRHAEQSKRFLKDATQFDGNRTDIDGEAIDDFAGRATTDSVQPFDEQDFFASRNQARSGAQSAGAGADHHGIVDWRLGLVRIHRTHALVDSSFLKSR